MTATILEQARASLRATTPADPPPAARRPPHPHPHPHRPG